MQLEEVAKALKELGHPTRLFIFKHLIKAGTQGLPVGELQKQLSIPASTLSHHISALVSVGLVKQNRESRTLMCVSQFEVLEEVIAFFREECCVNGSST
ncbi:MULTISPECIES: ArsR/SmtB family transcription factor [Aeromonas]|uniref:ArsR/SmtB family transcription factor n=1 Tax=Aeromonas TaxID=642 RepID=UPI000493A5C1|nr:MULTISPECIES: metalloregulator ArsR/SmtB family transcription factor [Aeromonas]ATM00757.1 ArsR family transcriptional regulator [Aeromonas sp. CA23]HAT1543761.1 helix-turn-helix transcriptional regulator [Aeromonas hydrophila]HAT1554229.1 helix-turn-helix transcriptional regulator [Aeromonas hydrophila]